MYSQKTSWHVWKSKKSQRLWKAQEVLTVERSPRSPNERNAQEVLIQPGPRQRTPPRAGQGPCVPVGFRWFPSGFLWFFWAFPWNPESVFLLVVSLDGGVTVLAKVQEVQMVAKAQEVLTREKPKNSSRMNGPRSPNRCRAQEVPTGEKPKKS